MIFYSFGRAAQTDQFSLRSLLNVPYKLHRVTSPNNVLTRDKITADLLTE